MKEKLYLLQSFTQTYEPSYYYGPYLNITDLCQNSLFSFCFDRFYPMCHLSSQRCELLMPQDTFSHKVDFKIEFVNLEKSS